MTNDEFENTLKAKFAELNRNYDLLVERNGKFVSMVTLKANQATFMFFYGPGEWHIDISFKPDDGIAKQVLDYKNIKKWWNNNNKDISEIDFYIKLFSEGFLKEPELKRYALKHG